MVRVASEVSIISIVSDNLPGNSMVKNSIVVTVFSRLQWHTSLHEDLVHLLILNYRQVGSTIYNPVLIDSGQIFCIY